MVLLRGDSVDPIVVAAQIVQGLQTIVSRQTELTKAGAVITIGSMHAGVRRNIIPETAMLEGREDCGECRCNSRCKYFGDVSGNSK
jgi:hypothetical protein